MERRIIAYLPEDVFEFFRARAEENKRALMRQIQVDLEDLYRKAQGAE